MSLEDYYTSSHNLWNPFDSLRGCQKDHMVGFVKKHKKYKMRLFLGGLFVLR